MSSRGWRTLKEMAVWFFLVLIFGVLPLIAIAIALNILWPELCYHITFLRC